MITGREGTSRVRVGLALSQYGAFANREAVIEVARTAESLGFHSLWTGDRLLDPVHPRDRYPGRADGRVPPEQTTFLDPLTVLTVAAGVTERIRLGTSTLNAPWHSPILLARTLTSIDVLSEGRLSVGFGLGWSSDEYAAAGVPWNGRGARLEEILDMLEQIWGEDPVTYEGPLFAVPESRIQPKPVQRPHPPVYLGGYSPAAIDRIGRRADGWMAPGAPAGFLTATWEKIRRAAEKADRDPDALKMVVRMNPRVTPEPVKADEVPFAGTVDQLAEYAHEVTEAGAAEVFADLQQTTSETGPMLDLADRLLVAIGTRL
ncbi:LLM class F420-dependent oxidoreductase [Actinomadura sp. DC4]|uniref:LLM class F420-dependent oxidoreductase n=1 Tax=Actinomadura sp. DC4 TaxID=3055069 RepID=UPI0025B03350|nr:LLM class F420-dependent oxidoreductase [Actinomadura sp. DC4]MDN3351612.1 LLM class F420-dependent oxidoreductase [Actinomadura sp. DC4]